MESSVTKTFRKQLGDLPASVEEQAAKAYALWQAAPYHPDHGVPCECDVRSPLLTPDVASFAPRLSVGRRRE